MRRLASLALPVLLLAVPAAAQETEAPAVFPLSDVDVPPETIGCAHVDPASATYAVRVDLVVDADGTVVPASVRGRSLDVRAFGIRHTPAEVVREAEEAAETCRFVPATRGGVAVAVRISKRFAFDRGPGGIGPGR